MGKQGRYSTVYIRDVSEVPDGYVPLGNWRHDRLAQQALSKAHTTGRIRAVKLVRTAAEQTTGPVWVESLDAEKFLASYQFRGRATAPTAERGPDATPAEVASGNLSSFALAALDVVANRLQEIERRLSELVDAGQGAADAIQTMAAAAESMARCAARAEEERDRARDRAECC